MTFEEIKKKGIKKTIDILLKLEEKGIISDWTIRDGYFSCYYKVAQDEFLYEGNSWECIPANIIEEIKEKREEYRREYDI